MIGAQYIHIQRMGLPTQFKLTYTYIHIRKHTYMNIKTRKRERIEATHET